MGPSIMVAVVVVVDDVLFMAESGSEQKLATRERERGEI
jgi:hypothetical protein